MDEQIKPKKHQKIIKSVAGNKPLKKHHYVIAVMGDLNLCQIVEEAELTRMLRRDKDILVLGVAKNQEGAIQIVTTIVSGLYDAYKMVTRDGLYKEYGEDEVS